MGAERTLKKRRPPQSGSFLHRFDPRTKIALSLLFTVTVFAADKLPVSGGLALVFCCMYLAAGMSVQKAASHSKFFLVLIFFIIIMQTVFGPGDRFILKPLIPETVPLIGGKGSLKRDGLLLGIVTALRLISLSLLMPLLTASTPPRLLSQGLVRLGLNYRAAYIITTALNLIPAFEEEARVIMNARRLRGASALEESGLFPRLGEYSAIAVPLIVSAMRKAQLSSLAMDARAFGAYKTKTWLSGITMLPADYAALIFGVLFSALALTMNFAVL